MPLLGATNCDCLRVLFGAVASLHYLSREPTMSPSLLKSLYVETAVTMGLNYLDRPLNMTEQAGCW